MCGGSGRVLGSIEEAGLLDQHREVEQTQEKLTTLRHSLCVCLFATGLKKARAEGKKMSH